jgi:hypothetical protein
MKAFPATLTRHTSIACAAGIEFARWREKIHNLDYKRGHVRGIRRCEQRATVAGTAASGSIRHPQEAAGRPAK